jgi:hypothetical protein
MDQVRRWQKRSQKVQQSLSLGKSRALVEIIPASRDAHVNRREASNMTLTRALLASAVLVCTAAPAFAQAAAGYEKPKTSWGAPDISGMWSNTSLTSMQRPAGAEKLVMTAEEATKLTHRNVYSAAEREEAGASKVDAEASRELLADKNASRAYNRFWMDPGSGYATVKGEYRSSWITFPADGKIPYTEAGIRANTRTNSFDDFEIRPLSERCIMSFTGGAGPVLNNGMYNNTYQIVQTPTSVMILTEMIHDVRVIPIGGKHGPTNIPKWGGDNALVLRDAAARLLRMRAKPLLISVALILRRPKAVSKDEGVLDRLPV